MAPNSVRTSDEDEALVAQFLEGKYHLTVERFTEHERRLGKTPDFKVSCPAPDVEGSKAGNPIPGRHFTPTEPMPVRR